MMASVLENDKFQARQLAKAKELKRAIIRNHRLCTNKASTKNTPTSDDDKLPLVPLIIKNDFLDKFPCWMRMTFCEDNQTFTLQLHPPQDHSNVKKDEFNENFAILRLPIYSIIGERIIRDINCGKCPAGLAQLAVEDPQFYSGGFALRDGCVWEVQDASDDLRLFLFGVKRRRFWLRIDPSDLIPRGDPIHSASSLISILPSFYGELGEEHWRDLEAEAQVLLQAYPELSIQSDNAANIGGIIFKTSLALPSPPSSPPHRQQHQNEQLQPIDNFVQRLARVKAQRQAMLEEVFLGIDTRRALASSMPLAALQETIDKSMRIILPDLDLAKNGYRLCRTARFEEIVKEQDAPQSQSNASIQPARPEDPHNTISSSSVGDRPLPKTRFYSINVIMIQSSSTSHSLANKSQTFMASEDDESYRVKFLVLVRMSPIKQDTAVQGWQQRFTFDTAAQVEAYLTHLKWLFGLESNGRRILICDIINQAAMNLKRSPQTHSASSKQSGNLDNNVSTAKKANLPSRKRKPPPSSAAQSQPEPSKND